MAPVPYVIKEPPNHIFIPIDYLLLRPQKPGAKPWKIFKIAHNLHEISLYLGHISFWRIPMNSFNNLDPSIEPINKVCKHNP